MGPTLPISEEVHALKHRQSGETFKQGMTRVAAALQDGRDHFVAFRDILLDMRFLPAGRVQSAMGGIRDTTPYNCFVAPTIPDSMDGIMEVAAYAAQTMRLGGGIGYDFSTLRPKNDLIRSLESHSSGPVSFMGIFDAICKTIASAGHRRGAQMGVLRVDHPDILEFIKAKQNSHNLTQFNISIGVTDEFMAALKDGASFDLRFNGRTYAKANARNLWDEIMRSTWDWAEPGVLFIDTINRMNNLWYCETIAATNPCGEQPLPPNGACLLGSFNMAKYIYASSYGPLGWAFDLEQFRRDIPVVVRAMDNVVDRAAYPLNAQRYEAISKRRMGLGVTGLANALEALGYPYGTPMFRLMAEQILETLKLEAYRASIELAAEKGAFPLFKDEYLDSQFLEDFPEDILDGIREHGIRNSHLTSIAPTGSISLAADNVSSGIEPVFSLVYERTINTPDGPRVEQIEDYGSRVFGVEGKTAAQCSIDDHLGVLLSAAKHVDSAVSKTCNVGDEVTWEEFKDVYVRAYEGGAKGITTFRASGKRYGILKEVPKEEGGACYIDPETGKKSCE